MSDSFDYFATIEPALYDLEDDVREAVLSGRASERFWAREVMPRLTALVGWHRPVPGAPRVEGVKTMVESAHCYGIYDLFDKGVRQARANAAALARCDPSDAFVHRELATAAAYRVMYDHLREILDGGL